ncbi:hypothetical protein GCM10007301_04110 [Azorhizobium oxalatiphilum]|uniref:Uncharacterized protein n=1 Tax=Azorhizobium oxalatiphilum TaxID=980631 RepID=A0A917BKU3_9HYPH|nr:hypothetical protein [Azorhizobium oxalatiphilum]GGF47974.1 hypothetical protein GCM10007301_04110 [Azorhizobium oxalatiphilum]
MIRLVIIGVWVCAVTLASSYGAAYWAAGAGFGKAEEPYLPGLEYRRVPTITVPMIIEGQVRGYVIAKLVFTADAGTLKKLSVDPVIFVTNDAFGEIYTNGRVEAGKISKYNLKDMMDRIKEKVNARLNGPVVQEILVDGINYIDKNDIRTVAGNQSPSRAQPEKVEAKSGH